VRTLSSGNATKPNRPSHTVTTPRHKSRLSTRLEAATSKRADGSEDTQLRQCVKAKATIPHGDDAEAQAPPQHTVGGGDSAAMRKSVRTLSSYNATKPRRPSHTVTTPRHKSRLSTRLAQRSDAEEREDTPFLQCDKAKANIIHGDDAEAQEPSQHAELEVATAQRCGRE
jgi:hypothetical protein